MNTDRLTEILRKTLDDGRVSRGEKKALRAVVEDLSAEDLDAVRRIAFDLAREAADDSRAAGLVDWFEDVLGATRVAPGSHRDPELERWGGELGTVPAELGPGDALIYSGYVFHGGGANQTAMKEVFGVGDDHVGLQLA